jgi:septal ring factor EnvC (AmiA/AmiB activator)
MMADSRIEDLEQRLRTAEADIVGDRHVSQYAAEQARRGTEAFLALRSEVAAHRADTAALRADIAGTTARVDALGENVAAINAMIVRHGRAIEVLMQDVRQIRGDMTELRQETAARFDRLASSLDVRQIRGDMTELRQETTARFDRLEFSLAAILAAVAPGHSPPA